MSHWPLLNIGYDLSIVHILIVLTTFSLLDTAAVDAICPKHTWWDQSRDACIRCTVCVEQSVVLRPCQFHKDTVCGTLEDLEIDWSFLGEAQKRVVASDWSEVSAASWRVDYVKFYISFVLNKTTHKDFVQRI